MTTQMEGYSHRENGQQPEDSKRKQAGHDVHVVPDIEQHTTKNGSPQLSRLIYSINDVPPWYLCIILGLQHYLTMFGGTLIVPLILANAICIEEDNVGKGEIISTVFFVCGLVTLMQVTLGTRLPIVQGGSFTFLITVFAIMKLDRWKCPAPPWEENGLVNGSMNGNNLSDMIVNNTTKHFDMLAWRREVWQVRMREVQGDIIVASLFQVVIGLSGVTGLMLRFIGPLVICPTITLIGLTLFEAAATYCSQQWGVAIMTIVFIIIFSQYLANVKIPCFHRGDDGSCKSTRFPFFQLFPIILAICLAWVICLILTYSGALSTNKNSVGYGARTDTKLSVLYEASWFRFPYPGQWGFPTVSAAGVFGMLAGLLADMIDSVGDYYACARLAGAPPPPIHAMNRGIMIEGIGSVLAGLWGTGCGTASYSENVGAIGITRVGSRRVIEAGAIIMILLGMLSKFGALFVTIPDPIIGGVFMVTFGMISAVGISNLQFVDLNSSRNLFVFGFSIFFGLSLPNWMGKNPGAISTTNEILDQIITVLLSTTMFVGGFTAFVLDNTIPGTPEERGLTVWREQAGKQDVTGKPDPMLATYNFPIGMSFIRKWKWTAYIPICPTFSVSKTSYRCCRKDRVTHM